MRTPTSRTTTSRLPSSSSSAGFPLTDALICTPDCSHHAVEEAHPPSDTPETDSTEKETVPDPKWLETLAEIKRMEDEGEIPTVEFDPLQAHVQMGDG